ncbi:MAG: peptidyl-prolyl cis-trans isomerase [Myxococcota bacterium]
MRLLRSPLLHFILLGIALFAASRSWNAGGDGRAEDSHNTQTLLIDVGRQTELQNTFFEQMGRPPTDGEWRGMLAAERDEEILYREALARGLLERDGGVKTRLIQKMLFLEGRADLEEAPELLERAVALKLHEGDIVVRRILVQKMRLLGSTLDASSRPAESEIMAAYRDRAEALREPDRRSLFHVFFSADRRPDSAAKDAETVLAKLRRPDKTAVTDLHESVSMLAALGDPFPLGHAFDLRSQHEIERNFGARFGAAVFNAEVGAWSLPIESAYGIHLVRVEQSEPGEIPALERVRDRIRHQLDQERREEQLEALLSDLRTRYEMVVEKPAGATPSAAGGS